MQKKPAYLTIKDHMINLICNNSGQSNYKMPSEQQICTKFKVSRITAKRALNELVEDGLVYRVQGKGTFITPMLRDTAALPVSNRKLLQNTRVYVIFPTTDSSYMRNILFGIIYTLREMDIAPLILYSCQDSAYEEKLIRQCISSFCSGIIVYPVDYENSNKDLFQLYRTKNVPVVYVDRIPDKGNLSYVIPDHYKTSRTVTEFLIQKGYKKLSFVISGSYMISSIGQRMAGFNHALKCAGLPFASYNFLNISEIDYSEIKARFLSFFNEYPDTDGMILPQGIVSTALADVLKELNKEPVRDIGIATYDNEIPDHNNPLVGKSLIIDQCPLHLGRAAAENLVSLILHQTDICETVYPSVIRNREIFDSKKP